MNDMVDRIRIHVGIETHEAWCPGLVHKDCCNGVCECASGSLGAAICAVLDKCDQIEVDLWGKTFWPGKFIADEFRTLIAEKLGVSTPDSPASGAGVLPLVGDTTSDGDAA
jgi:hypothetical protein